MPQIEGLPEGVRVVRYGGSEDEVYFLNPYGGIALGSPSKSLIVEAEDGYGFLYDVSKDSYIPVRHLPEPVTLVAKFKVCHEETSKSVERAIQRIPGFISVSRE